jgi:hypothetical protein
MSARGRPFSFKKIFSRRPLLTEKATDHDFKNDCIQKAAIVKVPRIFVGMRKRVQGKGIQVKTAWEVQMKRSIVPLLLFFIFGIFCPFTSLAEGNRSITILYTGSVWGNIDPCAA